MINEVEHQTDVIAAAAAAAYSRPRNQQQLAVIQVHHLADGLQEQGRRGLAVQPRALHEESKRVLTQERSEAVPVEYFDVALMMGVLRLEVWGSVQGMCLQGLGVVPASACGVFCKLVAQQRQQRSYVPPLAVKFVPGIFVRTF